MLELHRFISLTETFAKCWQPEINAAQSRRLLETEYWMSHTAALPTESHLSQRLKEAQIRGQKTEVACDYRKRRLTMKAFLPTVRRLSHCNVNTQSQQPSRRVGIAAPQSLVQNEVSTQSTARRVWDRAETDKKSMCVCISVSLRVPACEARIGKKQLGSSSQAKTGKQLLEGGGKTERGRGKCGA